MKIITISRQYGAGGREIGLAVGKELGVTLYDRDIIAATAKASSIDASQIEREGEEISATESILRNITPISYDQKDYIYETQRSVILDLAKQGPCVILGRCADVVLHDAGIETLNVYIYSDEAHRAERISGYLNTTDTAEIPYSMDALVHAVEERIRVKKRKFSIIAVAEGAMSVEEAAMKKKDRARRSYYEHYTGQHWGDCHNYDITLNSGSLGVEACVQLICAAVKAAENK